MCGTSQRGAAGVGDAPLGGQLVTSGQPPTVTYLVPASSIWFCALNVRIP